jgi:regulator of protease activity HflC (stomatin/prohibitin superfamily)
MIYASLAFIIFATVCFFIKRITYKDYTGQEQSFNISKVIGIPLLSLACILFLLSSMTVIPAGHVGIIDVFGNVPNKSLKPGINFVNPFAHIEKMSIKTQELKEEMNVPSREGLSVVLEASALFHINPEVAPDLYRSIGANYIEIMVEPNFRSVTRGITASYDAQALYTSNRELLASRMDSLMNGAVSKRGIYIENILLRTVTLPDRVANAIQEKLQAEQEAQRMTFVLEKERLEAERKVIEATGIQQFQEIVKQGINEQLLKWKGIEATQELAKSSNTKVIVIGNAKDGLPLILGGN